MKDVLKPMVRPATIYDSENWTMKSELDNELDEIEMRMLEKSRKSRI